MNDGGGFGQGQAAEVLAEFLRDLQIHLVVHQPQGGLGDLGGKFLDLDAVKLIDVAQDLEFCHVKRTLVRVRVKGTQDSSSSSAQFPVGNDQKVAAAASRIEKFQAGQALMKLESLFRWSLTFLNSARSSSRNSGPMSLRMFFSVV